MTPHPSGRAGLGGAAASLGFGRAFRLERFPVFNLNDAIPPQHLGRQLLILDVTPDRPACHAELGSSFWDQHVPLHLRSIPKLSPMVVVYHGRQQTQPQRIMELSTTVDNHIEEGTWT